MEKRSAGFPHTPPSVRLWLLGSPPDQVHGLGLHGTRPVNHDPAYSQVKEHSNHRSGYYSRRVAAFPSRFWVFLLPAPPRIL